MQRPRSGEVPSRGVQGGRGSVLHRPGQPSLAPVCLHLHINGVVRSAGTSSAQPALTEKPRGRRETHASTSLSLPPWVTQEHMAHLEPLRDLGRCSSLSKDRSSAGGWPDVDRQVKALCGQPRSHGGLKLALEMAALPARASHPSLTCQAGPGGGALHQTCLSHSGGWRK